MSSLQTLTPKLREARYPVLFDFSPLAKGQTVVSGAVSAINLRDSSPASIVEDIGVENGIFTVLLHSGVPGDSYKITPSVELADGSVFENDYMLEVVPFLSAKHVLVKQVAEVVDTGIFFASQLKDEIITSVSFLATDKNGNSADIVVDRGFRDDLVSFRVRGGIDGQDYTITVFVTTDAEDDHVYAEQVLVRVRNK